MNRTLIALALSSALLAPAPALAVRAKKKVHFLRPPRLDMPAYKSIGVVGIEGWSAAQLEGALVTAFLDQERGLRVGEGIGPEDPVIVWPNYFPLVERSRLDLVMGERNISSLSDEGFRDALGGVMEAGVLVTGTMKRPIHSEEWGTQSETKEVEVTTEHTETEVEVDIEETWYGDEEVTVTVKETTHEETHIEEREVVTEWCLTRSVLLSFDLRAIDVRTGQILAAETVRAGNSDYECSDNRETTIKSVQNVESLAIDTIDTIAYRAANRIAPYWGTRKLLLERNKSTKHGVLTLTKYDDLPGAAAWHLAELEVNSYDEWMQYNAGVLLASMYRFEEAEACLKAARAVKDRRIFHRLQNLIRDLRSDFRRLDAMGIPMRQLNLPSGASASAPAAAEEVQVRGGRKRMSELHKDHGGKGGVVVGVPGGMILTLVDRRDEWLQVRTFDGKVGWISIDDIR